jgi:hypothetical protein
MLQRPLNRPVVFPVLFLCCDHRGRLFLGGEIDLVGVRSARSGRFLARARVGRASATGAAGTLDFGVLLGSVLARALTGGARAA